MGAKCDHRDFALLRAVAKPDPPRAGRVVLNVGLPCLFSPGSAHFMVDVGLKDRDDVGSLPVGPGPSGPAYTFSSVHCRPPKQEVVHEPQEKTADEISLVVVWFVEILREGAEVVEFASLRLLYSTAEGFDHFVAGPSA